MRAVLGLVAFGLVIAGTACGGSSSHDDVTDESLIFGEEPKVDELASVVFLGGECTAAKVGPRHLLTAAHCLIDPATGSFLHPPGSAMEVTRHPSRGFASYEVAAVHVSPSWIDACEKTYCGISAVTTRLDAADVGLIVLERDLERVPVTSIDLRPLAEGDDVTILGFGCTEGVHLSSDTPDVARLRYATTRVVSAGNAIHEGSDVVAGDISTVSASYVLTSGPGGSKGDAPRAGLCPGDSGGPLLRRSAGRLVVVGVNSNYTLAPESSDEKGLPVTNWHTRLDSSSHFAVGPWLRSLGASTR